MLPMATRKLRRRDAVAGEQTAMAEEETPKAEAPTRKRKKAKKATDTTAQEGSSAPMPSAPEERPGSAVNAAEEPTKKADGSDDGGDEEAHQEAAEPPQSKWSQRAADPWRFCKHCGERTYVNKWYWGLPAQQENTRPSKTAKL